MKKPGHRCGVCLADHVLDDKGRLPRHGWNVVGAGRGYGQTGAHHTTACPGYEKRFAHLGISTEGSLWRLDQLAQHVAMLDDAHARLVAEPAELRYVFEYSAYDRATHKRRPRVHASVVTKGAERTEVAIEGYGRHFVPSYQKLLDSQIADIQGEIAATKRTIATFQEVVATWAPSDPYPVEVSGHIVHAARPWRVHEREVEDGTRQPADVMQVPLCRGFRRRGVIAPTSSDRDAVNCKNCLKAIAKTDAVK